MSIRTLSDEIDPRLLRCTFIIDFEKESRLENLYRIRHFIKKNLEKISVFSELFEINFTFQKIKKKWARKIKSQIRALEIVLVSDIADSHLDGARDEKFDGESNGDRIWGWR